jgi:multidrug transporter EmrE-like cation transporter
MNLGAYYLLLFAILLGVIGQVLLKSGMSRHPNFHLKEIIQLTTDLAILGGFLSYGLSTLLYFQVLARLDLSLAYPTVSLSYVLVILVSKLIFKENFTFNRWVAVIVICVGVALVGFGSK